MDDLVDSLPSMQALLQHRAATINMAAGPSALPTSVLLQATSGLLDYANTGMGLAELSHRGAPFQACLKDAEKDLRQLLAIPDDFAVLFLQGGGLTQFSMAPLNLVSAWKAKNKSPKEPKCEYVVSGSWSAKAAGEARRLGMDVNVVIDGREPSKGGEGSKKGAFGEQQLPPSEQWNWTPKADDEELPAFIYYCSNETVNGVEIPPPAVPAHLKDVPLCADMSSNVLSRPIPWTTANFGLVYAGAQKNVGPSGLTLVFVRKDLIVDPDEAVQYNGPRIPAMLAYKSHADNGSLYNTPSMFPIYVAGLVFKHLQQMGGVEKIEEINIMKAQAVYKAVDESDGFYQARVIPSLRSRMNICFGLPNAEGREERFIKEAEKAGIKQIKGHRSVGGIRTSLYNAVTLDQVQTLVGFMRMFQKKEQEISQHTINGTASGKTAILRQVLDDIEPTLNVENVPTTAPNVNTLRAFLDFDVWDCPGERYDIENLQGLHVNQIGACIFVIDALSFEGDSANQVRKIASAIYKIHRFDSRITFDIFCHKTEGKGDSLRMDLQQDIRNRLTDELHDLADDDPDTLNTGYTPIPIIYHFTSIFQPSIWDALSKIVSRLMPCQTSLEKLLDLLCDNCKFDKVYLFDMELKLYFATDSTPADKVTHELCMEYIDFHWEMDQIYGPEADIPEEAKSRTNSFGHASSNGALERTKSLKPDLSGLKPLRKYASGSVTLSNGIAMAHWQITGDVALVARVASQTLDQAPAILEHNISTIRQAVSALYDLETRR